MLALTLVALVAQAACVVPSDAPTPASSPTPAIAPTPLTRSTATPRPSPQPAPEAPFAATRWVFVGYAAQNRLVGDTLELFSDALQVDLDSGGTRIIFHSNWHPRSEMDSPSGLKPSFTTTRLISAITTNGIDCKIDPGARTRVSSDPFSPDTCYSTPGRAIKRPDGTQLVYMSCGAFTTRDGLELTQITSGFQYLRWPPEPDASYDAGWADTAIVQLGDGRYRMYRTLVYGAPATVGTPGQPGYVERPLTPQRTQRILSYISTDGFTFTREPGVRIPEQMQWKWAAGSCRLKLAGQHIVHRAQDGTWAMYFKNEGCLYEGPPPVPGTGFLNAGFSVATSKDGLDWTLTEVSNVEGSPGVPADVYAVLTSRDGDTLIVYSCLGADFARDLKQLLSSGLCVARKERR